MTYRKSKRCSSWTNRGTKCTSGLWHREVERDILEAHRVAGLETVSCHFQGQNRDIMCDLPVLGTLYQTQCTKTASYSLLPSKSCKISIVATSNLDLQREDKFRGGYIGIINTTKAPRHHFSSWPSVFTSFNHT